MTRTVEERFLAKCGPALGGCIPWEASRTPRGYGQFYDGVTIVYAHRWAYEHAVGPIPAGLQIDHLCGVRHCVNLAHLEAVTSRENTLRGDTRAAANLRKTHCPQGHRYDEANTYRRADGGRQCRMCQATRRRRAREERST